MADTNTPNYNLIKQDPLGFYSVEKFNQNFDTIDTEVKELSDAVGNIVTLNTEQKNSLVVAVNELLTKIGTLSSLSTEEKTNLVDAVNEIKATVTTHLAESDYLPYFGSLKDIDYNAKVYTAGSATDKPHNSSFFVDAIVRGDDKKYRKLIARRYNNNEIWTLTMNNGFWGEWINETPLPLNNIAKGMVNITPTAPNTPTSHVVSWSLPNPPVVTVSAVSAVPGRVSVSVATPTSTSGTIWLERTDTTETGVNYIAIS